VPFFAPVSQSLERPTPLFKRNSRIRGNSYRRPKRMPSELKSATSRANGAKSRGPKTPETKERSSRNSLRHGIVARKTILLECEDPNQFQEMLEEYAETYQPGNAGEQ